LATAFALAGWVNNSPLGVFIEVEGHCSQLEQFLFRLELEKPPRSSIHSLEASWLDPVGYSTFDIRESETDGAKTALVLPDIATCPDCLREVFDPGNRRYRYPFTNCTNCGPRFSIVESLPYDRTNTSMKSFVMCSACKAEYDDPANRRFHAQPNACPDCGPHLELWDRSAGAPPAKPLPIARNHFALLVAAEAIRRGQIVAVKGLGGFHLMVDARNEAAVRRLRKRKHRDERPFALMFPSLESVKSVCEVSPLEVRLLRSPESPIVLLKRIANIESQIVSSVAPGNPFLGAMLPCTPLHHLLMAELGIPIVATSGNLSDEPICTDEHEALERLRGIADVFLAHNRPIVRHVDDSVARVVLGREMVLRRARGYAPLPIVLKSEIGDPKSGSVLAVGGHLKNTIALSVGNNAFISQHIGDLETEQARDAFRHVIADFEKLYGVKPEVIAADLHPDYLSTKFALQVAGAALEFTLQRVPLPQPDKLKRELQSVSVQHHIAHVLSCMAENAVEPPVLGVSWDGTGHGLDGTIWGGEFFLVGDDKIDRIAHLRAFPLPGGNSAVKEPRRAALGLLYQLAVERNETPLHMQQSFAALFGSTELSGLRGMLARNLNSPSCSSVGRLFDAVASLTGLRQQVRFEGQAAMELEFALNGIETEEAYSLPIKETANVDEKSEMVLDWSPMIEAILADVKRGVSIGDISARFHNALVEAIVTVARTVREARVVLSGGCFQNRYLTERAVHRLRQEGFQPYWHQRVPPNDGGIALGQVMAALRSRRGFANHK
jgi:hydrogenase maturation protein HypF